MTDRESATFRIQTPESHFDIRYEEERKKTPSPGDTASEQSEMVEGRSEAVPLEAKPSMSLGLFKLACPEFVSLTAEGVRTWRDVLASADLLRGMLGISPDAMRRAEAAMGPVDAAITVACILERHEAINSPGGYLRALTQRAADGEFSVRPMVDALIPK